ncbi:MAG TPA: ABC transporter permease [Solirubrobacteraceae bacterium]|nr:ABC transporter permease [Solirubrobacteraceae bacterium]
MGVVLSAAMLAAAIVIAEDLGNGFNRAARAADLGQLIVRFDSQRSQQIAKRIEALPDIAGFALRTEVTSATISYGAHVATNAVGEVIGGGHRQGFAVVSGRPLHGRGREVLVEAALASAWHISIGDWLRVRGLGRERVVGFAEGPDDVGYPLAAPRFYVSRASLAARFGPDPDPYVNFAEIWLRNPRYLDEVLVQARDESFGLRDVQFATRDGVRVLVHQAAGIVIDLLVALSVIALATAAVMLAASSRAEVQRRLRSIGIRRAVGASRAHVTLTQALEALLTAVPAATLGTFAGWLATYGAGNRLLALLNEPGPGASLILPLLAGWLASVAIPVAGAAWPAWAAGGRAVVSLLRGADVARGRSSRRPRPRRTRGRQASGAGGRGSGLSSLGARLVAARPARLAATVTMLACSTAFILLMVALAGTLSSLETDPQELGKHYQLTASLPPAAAPLVARIPGVAAAAPRYGLHAADAYSLGELVDVIAYPRDHTRFEAPPLVSGRRLQGDSQAEVGVGLADAMGLAPGSELLLQLPSDRQLRLRVAGTVSSLDDQGLVAYVPAAALLADDPSAPSQIAVLLKPGASQEAVTAALTRLGAAPQQTSGAVARGAPLVAVLKTILIAIAIVDGLVCLYALTQACSLTVQERRRTVAVLRACGAGSMAVHRLLAGAVLALLTPAAILGILLERLILGPALSKLAAGYATLELQASAVQVLATVAGLVLAGALAVWWVARSAMRESVITGLAA